MPMAQFISINVYAFVELCFGIFGKLFKNMLLCFKVFPGNLLCFTFQFQQIFFAKCSFLWVTKNAPRWGHDIAHNGI